MYYVKNKCYKSFYLSIIDLLPYMKKKILFVDQRFSQMSSCFKNSLGTFALTVTFDIYTSIISDLLINNIKIFWITF